jgi:hypothetical protein
MDKPAPISHADSQGDIHKMSFNAIGGLVEAIAFGGHNGFSYE